MRLAWKVVVFRLTVRWASSAFSLSRCLADFWFAREQGASVKFRGGTVAVFRSLYAARNVFRLYPSLLSLKVPLLAGDASDTARL